MDRDRVMLTARGRAMLTARLEELTEQVLPSMRPLLVEDERDERVVADFERLEAEHDRLAALLGTAGTIDEATLGATVSLGSRVVVRDSEGRPVTVRIVHPAEAFLDDERISAQSPLARALMGHSVGDRCEVHAPGGTWTAEVLQVGPGD